MTERAATMDGILRQTEDTTIKEYLGDSVSNAYRLKSKLFSSSLSAIGMGRYQWEMFIISGIGWLINNLTAQGLASALIPVDLEFRPVYVGYATVGYYLGSTIGSCAWGVIADVIGRRPSFNITLYWTAIFFTAAGGANNFITFAALQACIGLGAGANATIDVLIMLECLPASYQWLIAAFYAWWSCGQIIASLLSWVYLANFSCPTEVPVHDCVRAENMGWRYTTITLGLFTLSFALFRMLVLIFPESPQYLLSVGRDEEAIAALNYIAAKNGKPQTVTIADLELIDHNLGTTTAASPAKKQHPSAMELIKRSLADYNGSHIKALFSTRKMTFHIILLWTISAVTGIAYSLYFNFIPSYLAEKFTTDPSLNATYRTYCIVSAVSVAGPIAACFLIETRFGRKWIMAIFFFLTGVFLYLYTTADDDAASVGFQCAISIFGNLAFAILCVMTPESFPAPRRGTGSGIAYALQYLAMMFAPIIASNTGFTTVPIYVSAGLWFVCGILTCLLPFETHNRAAV